MLSARSYKELRRLLPSLDVIVPPRGAGRTSEHTERYAVARLLASLPPTLLQFPLELTKGERPDFRLLHGGNMVGIEHTEAVPANKAWADSLRTQGHGPEFHFLQRASVGDPKPKKDDLLKAMERNDPGAGWAGDSVERDWAAAIIHFVEQKCASATKPGFMRLRENWLLIYDNWPAPGLDHLTAVPMLRRNLDAIAAWATFSRIYVLDESALIDVDAQGFSIHEVRHPRRRRPKAIVAIGALLSIVIAALVARRFASK